MMKVDLAIIVPCYNEEEVLVETTRQLAAVLDALEADGKIKCGKKKLERDKENPALILLLVVIVICALAKQMENMRLSI